ncbi:uncharacterized protein [Magallana gigas]|uniref:uncharacterized protein n=1 Tax=Magallana gigas TaxID=29159 RepID=UPI0033409362
MPGTGKREFPCILCRKRTKPTERRTLTAELKQLVQKMCVFDPSDEDVLCTACRIKCHVKLKKHIEKKDTAPKDTLFSPQQQGSSSRYARSPPSVTLPLPSSATSHARCFICKRPGPKLIVVPTSERNSVFLHQKILIPYGSRCCSKHIPDGRFTSDALKQIPVFSQTSSLNRSSIVDILLYLRETALRYDTSRIDFDRENAFSDQQYTTLTGLSKNSFNDLLSYISDSVKNTSVRSARNSLGIFLVKMKSGLCNSILSTIFNVSKASIRRAIHTVRRALMENFVPQNLGFQHISRESVIQHHTRPLAESLFGGTGSQALLVLDGTYIYIQKSSNFTFQRKSYSLHKGRPLVKPMVIVSTSGYYISVIGPYLARNNDAAILQHIMKSNREDVLKWVEEDDIFIIDRGFRDSVAYLEELGIQAIMPAFMKKGEKQMSTPDANTSRLVTKIRWVVESANARIKRWKLLDCILPTSQIPFIGDYVKIVCSISNKYYPPLSSGDRDADMAVAAKMQFLAKQVNHLKEEVEARKLHSRVAMWRNPEDLDSLGFPHLDEDDIRNITCGVYQLKLASSYAAEHFQDGSNILIHKEDPNLLRIKIQSRHVSAKSYLLWIRFDESSITGWYCQCKAGARVVGVCAHVAAVIWYIGLRNYKGSFKSVQDWGRFVDDASVLPEPVDESESDEDLVEE